MRGREIVRLIYTPITTAPTVTVPKGNWTSNASNNSFPAFSGLISLENSELTHFCAKGTGQYVSPKLW